MKSLTILVGAALLGATLFASAVHAKPAKLKPLSEADVLKLVELSIDDKEIIKRLKNGGGVDFKVNDDVIDHLKKAGASEAVLTALQGKQAPAEKIGEKVLASGQHKSGAFLELTELKRTSDGFLMVNFHYRNPTDAPLKPHHGFAVTRDTDVTDEVFSAIYYVEPNQKRKHGVAQDNGGKLVALMVVAGDLLAPAKGTGGDLWVKMSGPSDGVDKVTFYFPGVAPMEDVALPPASK